MVGFINKKYFDDQMVEKYPFYLVLNRSVIFCDTVQEYEMLLEIIDKFVVRQMVRAQKNRKKVEK